METSTMYALDTEHLMSFVTGGHAIFTIKSEKTGVHFTFRVRKDAEDKVAYFVDVRTGTDFSYIGYVSNQTGQFKTKLAWEKGTAVYAFAWFWSRLMDGKQHDDMTFYHMGACGRCGRPLTNPESIEIGLGPYCAGEV